MTRQGQTLGPAEAGNRCRAVEGTVYLVGAGPGDPDLLTVRARRLLDRADVVLHDALVSPAILDTISEATTVRDVGKRSNGERTAQAEINRLMVEYARAGATVVRLKGGDPTVFGRGGEEAQHLAARGISVETVPGVSSVLSTSPMGIPLTHRDHASSVTVITGHESPSKDESALDWEALANTIETGGTLIVLMGVGRLPEYVSTLRDCGLDPDTPVAMVEKATRADEQTVTGTVESIVRLRDEAGIEPPAITIVGDVVTVREDVIDALQRGGLAGREAAIAPVAPRPNLSTGP